MEINLYQIQHALFHKTFGNFIIKLCDFEKGGLCIICQDDAQVKKIDDMLWTFAQLSFLPHAAYYDDVKQGDVPVIITNKQYIKGRVPVYMSLSLVMQAQHEKTFVIDVEFQNVNSLKNRFVKERLSHKIFRQEQFGKWRTY